MVQGGGLSPSPPWIRPWLNLWHFKLYLKKKLDIRPILTRYLNQKWRRQAVQSSGITTAINIFTWDSRSRSERLRPASRISWRAWKEVGTHLKIISINNQSIKHQLAMTQWTNYQFFSYLIRLQNEKLSY